MSAARVLQVLLVVFGATAATAVVPMVMPWEWMVHVHERWLGLGALEHRPVVEYLARATSGLCAFYGVLLLILATDVRRYRAIIIYQAAAVLVLTTVAAPFNHRAGLPMWWTVCDLVSCWVFCVPMIVLARKV